MKNPSHKSLESHFARTQPGMVCVKLEGEKVQSKDSKSFWLTFKIDDNGVDLKDYVRYDNEKVQKLWKKIEKRLQKKFSEHTDIILKSWRGYRKDTKTLWGICKRITESISKP